MWQGPGETGSASLSFSEVSFVTVPPTADSLFNFGKSHVMKLMIRSESPYVLAPGSVLTDTLRRALCAKWAHHVANLTRSVNHGTPPCALNISLQFYSMDGTWNFPGFQRTGEQFWDSVTEQASSYRTEDSTEPTRKELKARPRCRQT